ncbi:hypothetical protein HanPSC8_Chr13g0587001 [Helianthus annuus]|nr:hypothetical protein HanPSC8_Chr13g0587001 [Helianthus annuus]
MQHAFDFFLFEYVVDDDTRNDWMGFLAIDIESDGYSSKIDRMDETRECVEDD